MGPSSSAMAAASLTPRITSDDVEPCHQPRRHEMMRATGWLCPPPEGYTTTLNHQISGVDDCGLAPAPTVSSPSAPPSFMTRLSS